MRITKIFWSAAVLAVLSGLIFIIVQPEDSPWAGLGAWVYWGCIGLFAIALMVRIFSKASHRAHDAFGPVASAGQTYQSLMTGSADQGAFTAITDSSLTAMTPLTELPVEQRKPSDS
ncbi:hypothetical protein SLW73_10635 [Glutamicibacter protophormiae]|uniref:hypothetical protein n=1 Tax=Glutamicibacter protophormiae TaxID=37930 RepID=UPI002A82886E|nr:hypothetical protein [Glutamicibacter protophormiae]WPR63344.1 hypothetical protein SLW72_10640 [Glutamicibacter protophormiae]WPR66840.1 hypothetical protein SLW73_10635 [Glutamicibacter protophormiae]